MARIQGSLAHVSTEFEVYEPDTYTMQIKKVEVKTKDDENGGKDTRVQYIITLEFADGEYKGRKLMDFIEYHKKDGEINPIGQIQLKRYFEAVVGEERANEDDLDTDELLDGDVLVELKISSYTKDGKEKKNNKITSVSPLG